MRAPALIAREDPRRPAVRADRERCLQRQREAERDLDEKDLDLEALTETPTSNSTSVARCEAKVKVIMAWASTLTETLMTLKSTEPYNFPISPAEPCAQ